MLYRTTILIDETSLKLLKRAALLKKKRESEMINIIVKNTVRRYLLKRRKFVEGTIKYQNQKNNYTVYHYSVSRDIYEACLDLRKFYKMSVSMIINKAIKKMLGKVVGESERDLVLSPVILFASCKITDNYILDYNISTEFNQTGNELSAEIRILIT